MVDNSKREKVYHVFQEISGSYDKANERISLGLEKRWKKELVQEVSAKTAQGDSVLDVCCGIGDIAIALAKSCSADRVVDIDFSPAMLEAAEKKKRPSCQYILADRRCASLLLTIHLQQPVFPLAFAIWPVTWTSCRI